MRNTSSRTRGTWATFVTRARAAARLPKVELARRLGVDRATISRWESGITRPEKADVVQRFTDLLALDLEEGLAAAGLRPSAPSNPQPPMDPDVAALLRKLRDPNTSPETIAFIRSTLRYLVDLPSPAPRKARKAAG